MPDPKIPLAQHEADARRAATLWRHNSWEARCAVDDHESNCDPQTMAAFYRVVRAAAAARDTGDEVAKRELNDALEAFEL